MYELFRVGLAAPAATAAPAMRAEQMAVKPKHQQLAKRATLVICHFLRNVTPMQILRVPGCGRHTYKEIEQMMHDNGYWIGDDRRHGPWGPYKTDINE